MNVNSKAIIINVNPLLTPPLGTQVCYKVGGGGEGEGLHILKKIMRGISGQINPINTHVFHLHNEREQGLLKRGRLN